MTFLSDAQLLAVCRRLEHISSFLSTSGNLSSADGNHSEIRQHMRVFLKNAELLAIHNNTTGETTPIIQSFIEQQRNLDPSRQYTVVVNLDDALQT